MQSDRRHFSQPRDNKLQDAAYKKWLLGIIAAVTVSSFIILASPHLFHTSTIYHFILHLASITIAVFISTISFVSYRNSGSQRVLLTALSFVALSVVELLMLLNAAEVIGDVTIPVVDIDVSHVFLFGMLALFGLGVLKVNK
ncbi:MAG: hypothetical protein ABI361_13270 [Nitrososphaera sp.]|jgi:hypothetical protein